MTRPWTAFCCHRRSIQSGVLRWVVVLAMLIVPATALAGGSDSDLSGYNTRPADRVWRSLVRVDRVPASIDGSGVGIALIDSGVADVPDLHNRVVARVDFTEQRDGLDTFGHGTHMAGLIVGDGTSSADQWVGAAPGADLISLKVASWNGATDTSSVIAALRWVVTNKDRYNIRVVNISFGTDASQTYRSDPLDRAVERAWEAGVVVVVSAGNQGPLAGSITKPGDDPRVVTVGAYDDANTLDSEDDHVAAFSARGPTQDGVAKPDIVAPGVSIVSTRAPDSTIDVFNPAARVDGDYFKGTGTSQAAAIVSGIAALVIQANPALTPDQVKGILLDTANDNLAGESGAGNGTVNARRAVDAARGIVRWTPLTTIPAPSSGLGSLEGTRGTNHVYADLNGDGAPDLVAGETDVLGGGFDAATAENTPWTIATWNASPWVPLAVETPGFSLTPFGQSGWLGAASDALGWGARSWGAAGWTARSWGARSWGARSWGARSWGAAVSE
jgi:serine protease AprX